MPISDIDARQIAMTTSLEVTEDEARESREAAANEAPPVRVVTPVRMAAPAAAHELDPRRGPGRPRNPAHSATKHTHNPDAPISPFGGVPPNATHWSIFRKVNSQWEKLHWGPPGEMSLREWPLDELTAANIKARWGAGNYRPQFLRPTDRGGMRSLNHGKEVILTDDGAPATVAAILPTPPAPSLDSLASALRVLDVIEGQADRKIAGMALLAQQFAGNRSEGITASDLREILRAQAETTAAAIATALAPIHAQLAAFEEEDDDEENPIGMVASAAAPLLRGKGTWVQLLNFAAANPGLAEAVIVKGLPLVAGIADVVTSALRAVPPPPPPVARPQALIPPEILAERARKQEAKRYTDAVANAVGPGTLPPIPTTAHTNTAPPPDLTPAQRSRPDDVPGG